MNAVLAQAGPAPRPLDPGLVLAFVLLDITIILIAARLLGALARRIGQPTVVGEIVAGGLLGPSLLGRTVFAWDRPWSFLHCDQGLVGAPAGRNLPSVTDCVFPVQARGILSVLGQIAPVSFMFLVGLELDWKLLKGKGAKIASVSLGAVAVAVALGFAIAPVLYSERFVPNFADAARTPSQASFTIMIAAMLSVTAFPVMARISRRRSSPPAPWGPRGSPPPRW